MKAAGVSAAALGLAACGGSSSSTAASAASSTAASAPLHRQTARSLPELQARAGSGLAGSGR
ncbi:MAG: hypothetical protein ACLVJH_19735 [Faecalibacterium prausnitzii]